MGARGRCVGCLLLYVTADREVDADEQAFLHAIADQSAVAVENARLFGEAESHATLVERQRLARELHDSVSQALFSMTLHARTAERRLAAHGVPEADPLAVSLATLSDLTRGALAEMRALIFELRPGALERDGLVAALTRQAQAINAREGLTIAVQWPGRAAPARRPRRGAPVPPGARGAQQHGEACRCGDRVGGRDRGRRRAAADDRGARRRPRVRPRRGGRWSSGSGDDARPGSRCRRRPHGAQHGGRRLHGDRAGADRPAARAE